MTARGSLALAALLSLATAISAPAEPRFSSAVAEALDAAAPSAPGIGAAGKAGEASSVGDAGQLIAGSSAPSLGAAATRVAGATALVGILLAVTLLVLRRLFRGAGRSGLPRLRPGTGGRMAWLSRFVQDAGSDAERLEILDRRAVGAKESVCLVRAGGERFLIGVTTSRVSLLGRLDSSREAAAAVALPAALDEPDHADFGRAALGEVADRPPADEASFRALLDRSRQRLTRLGIDSVHAGARRE